MLSHSSTMRVLGTVFSATQIHRFPFHLAFAAAAVACVALPVPAAVPLGSVQTFRTPPAAGDWSTHGVGTSADTYTDAAALDAAVTNHITASAVATAVGSSMVFPPVLNDLARWNNNFIKGYYLQTRPNTNDYLLLMATLVNNAGESLDQVTLTYDWGQSNALPASESIPGHRVFYSQTGAAGSWMLIPEFSTWTVDHQGSNVTATLSLEAWPSGANLYILWADDNGPGGASAPAEGGYTIDNFYAVPAGPPQPPRFTVNLPPEVHVVKDRSTNLTVAVAGFPPFGYRWFKEGVGEISGATTPTLSLTNAQFGVEDGQYYCVATNVAGSATSVVAVLTVVPDVYPPLVLSAAGNAFLDQITVRFDEPVEPGSGEDFFNYAVRGGPEELSVGGAVLAPDGLSVLLTLSGESVMQENTLYTVGVVAVADLLGNQILEETNVAFRSWVLAQSFLRFETYTNIPGSTVPDLTAAPAFPDSPGEQLFLRTFDTRTVHTNDAHDTYGTRVTGVFIPPETGHWLFYLRSDDAAELYLNPAGPDRARKTLLTQEFGRGQPFSVNVSGACWLLAGQPYYLEALHKEDASADFCQVAAKLESDPTPPDSLAPISPSQLGCYVDTNGVELTLTQQPASQTAVEPATATPVAGEDFNSDNGGFTVASVNNPGKPWTHGSGTWFASDQTGCGTVAFRHSRLSSPYYTVPAAGPLTLSFVHRYSWEADGTLWDAGQVRISVNRGLYVPVSGDRFTAEGYTGVVGGGSVPSSDLAGQEAFTSVSTDYTNSHITSTAVLGPFAASDCFSIQFFAAWDDCSENTEPNWELDSLQFSPAVEDRNSQAPVTFTVRAAATRPGAPDPPLFYQWQRDNGSGFVDIAEATGASYSLAPSVRDNGARFRCLVQTPGITVTSDVATLAVAPLVTRPTLDVAWSGGSVVITWPAPSTGFVLEETAALLDPPTDTVWTPEGSTPEVTGDMNRVTCTPAAGSRFYRLTRSTAGD
ncbi:MAG: Ig-like domain-containing protein [Verrucomicrobia bacterium]|nr:Ig-like domain-containing protein [Verrucomicrobiota bacterium]